MREVPLLKNIFTSFVIFYAGFLYGSNVVQNDRPYFAFKVESYNFIFPEEYKEFADKIIYTSSRLIPHYENIYGHKVDEQTDVMLASHHNQIGNGFATMLPYSQTVLYPGGMFLFDDFATSNWLATLTYHELSHIFQLNVKTSEFSKISKSVLGNNWINFFPMPINLFPMMTLPPDFALKIGSPV